VAVAGISVSGVLVGGSWVPDKEHEIAELAVSPMIRIHGISHLFFMIVSLALSYQDLSRLIRSGKIVRREHNKGESARDSDLLDSYTGSYRDSKSAGLMSRGPDLVQPAAPANS
jgi:hypothetical protein